MFCQTLLGGKGLILLESYVRLQLLLDRLISLLSIVVIRKVVAPGRADLLVVVGTHFSAVVVQ